MMMNNDTNNSNPGQGPVEIIDAQQIEEGKTMAMIAYLTIIGTVIALVMNSDKRNLFAKFHIRQALGLMLTGLGISFISWIPFLGWIIGLVAMFLLLILWITGLMNAVNGRAKTLPILGNMYAEWFKSL